MPKIPEYVRRNAVDRVEELMVQAIPWAEIRQILIDEGHLSELSPNPGPAESWRREVQKRWNAEDAELRPARKDLWRARLEGQYRDVRKRAADCDSPAMYAMLNDSATKIAKLAIQLDGLQEPKRVHVTGETDVADLSPRERQQEIDALLAKKAEWERRRASAGEAGN